MWGKLVKRARQSDPRAGAAILRGVLDAVDELAPAARAAVVETAAAWPQRDVRQAAAAITVGREPDTGSSPAEPTAPLSRRDAAAQPSLL